MEETKEMIFFAKLQIYLGNPSHNKKPDYSRGCCMLVVCSSGARAFMSLSLCSSVRSPSKNTQEKGEDNIITTYFLFKF